MIKYRAVLNNSGRNYYYLPFLEGDNNGGKMSIVYLMVFIALVFIYVSNTLKHPRTQNENARVKPGSVITDKSS